MKNRILVKNILFTLVALVLTLSALAKFMGRESIQTLFASVGLEAFIIRIAVVQLIIVACLFYKPLRSLGVLIGSAFLGGAIFMLVATDQSPLSATLTLLILWAAYKLEWWGYWNHYTEDCACGWCKPEENNKRKKGMCPNPKDECDCGNHCDCPKGKCTCS